MNIRFKKYWRKTGLNVEWGSLFLSIISEKKPKHFLEIGVFCGVTSRNVCELLNVINDGDFSYTGFDLFGEKVKKLNEEQPEYIKDQKFSNPLKNIYYNFLLRENLNSVQSINKFLTQINFYEKIKNFDIIIDDGSHIQSDQLLNLNFFYKFIDEGGFYIIEDYKFPKYFKHLNDGRKRASAANDSEKGKGGAPSRERKRARAALAVATACLHTAEAWWNTRGAVGSFKFVTSSEWVCDVCNVEHSRDTPVFKCKICNDFDVCVECWGNKVAPSRR